MRTALLTLVMILVSTASAAFDTGGSSFGADDPAAIHCELLGKMYERAPTGTERQFYNWAQGYFAGRSASAPAAAMHALPATGEARERAFSKILAFCAKNPESTFSEAVLAEWQASAPLPATN